MRDKLPEIIVTGDICINLLTWQKESSADTSYNYHSYPSVRQKHVMGGALLLSRLVEDATQKEVAAPVITDVNSALQDGVLVSVADLEKFPAMSSDKNEVYRIHEFSGYYLNGSEHPKLLPVMNDNAHAKMVILEDNNNGFNAHEEVWPAAIQSADQSPVILYKTNNTDFQNKLWMHIEANHLTNTVVIINAEDLRAKGVNISKGLSWEKTALDFVWQMKNNPKLKHLSNCTNLVIPFGLEGAIYYHKEDTAASKLYFFTNEAEGGFIPDNHGKMYGLTSCFVAGLAKAIACGMDYESLPELLDSGIRQGMFSAQDYFRNGFGQNLEQDVFPDKSLFDCGEHGCNFNEYIQDVNIKNTNNPNCQGCWYIIKDKSTTNLEEIAYEIVKEGEDSALKYIPIAQFRNLKTVDRTEIEAYRSIKNLIAEYISTKNTLRPLSIAVFGTPGSGKSFGVTEVAASIAPDLIQKLDFNLSQFQSVNDLIAAFHKVRDVSLNGKLPLVFFDEFDSAYGEYLGWLKYLLAPMQDGVFREGDSIHPIGKAIFVFAGGTSSTYEAFCGENIVEDDKLEAFQNTFKNAKGPDFVSRLRGYVNILGPNQTDKKWDQLFIIRRAMLLRSLLVRKTPFLINGNGEAQVDNGIIRALLKIPKYKHESRSMEAIMEMSMLAGVKKWEQSHLPSKSQLKLHVDEQEFYHYMMQEEFYCEKINSLSCFLVNQTRKQLEGSVYREQYGKSELKLMSKWIYEQVKHIPQILYKADYELSSVSDTSNAVEFSQHELNFFAQLQHELWLKDRKREGWKYGSSLEEEKLLSPFITSWDSLNEDTKNLIIQYVSLWPEALLFSRLKIEKLNYLCYCESHACLNS